MAADGDQTASRRRTQRTGGYDRESPLYRDMSRPSMSPRTTDNYCFDEGMFDIPRSSSSVVRMSQTTGNVPRQPGTQPSPVPQRRQSTQSTGNTREMPSPQNRQTQSRQTQTRQTQSKNPRYSVPQMQSPYSTPNATRGVRPATRTSPTPVRTKDVKPEKPARRVHWFLPAGVGMIVMLALWVVGSNALAWATQRYNDFTYGTPRTYQTDAVVGHNNDSNAHPSHFIAINLNHEAVIIELQAGDPGKSVSYVEAFIGDDSDNLDPITLEFKDVNSDSKPDMIVHVHRSNQDQVFFFLNDGKQFVAAKGNEKINYNSN
jgi:hypothetical protein